ARTNNVLGRDIDAEGSFYPKFNCAQLPAPVLHVALSCDELTLSVVVDAPSGSRAYLFDTRAFQDQNPQPFMEIRLVSDDMTRLADLQWNPVDHDMFATCLEDGSVSLYQIKDTNFQLTSLPPALSATLRPGCMCWSQRGKQLAVGCGNGSIVQLKPDLQVARDIRVPPINNAAFKFVDLLWVSNFIFCAAVVNLSEGDKRLSVVVIMAPKSGPVTCTSYEDICYSTGVERPLQYFLHYIHEWGIVVGASANATEVGVIGLNAEKNVWEQWFLEDSGRAELPLSGSIETFPVGLAVDRTSQNPMIVGESQKLPPMPVLLLLSTEGMLIPFHMVNKIPDSPVLSQAVQPFPMGIRLCSISLPRPSLGEQMLLQAKPESSFSPAGSGKPSPSMFPSTPKTTMFSSGLAATTASTTSAPGVMFTPGSSSPFTAASGFSSFSIPGSASQSAFMKLSPEPPKYQPQHTEPAAVPVASIQPPSSQMQQPTEPAMTRAASETSSQGAKEKEQNIENALTLTHLKQEIMNFETDLQSLHKKVYQLHTNVGSKQEMCDLREGTDRLELAVRGVHQNFEKKTKEREGITCNILESFAIMEEAKSLQTRVHDESFMVLLRKRSLDPLLNRHMKSIHHYLQYVCLQSAEVERYLDMESETSAYRKSKMQVDAPCTETIYRILINNRKIIASKKSQLSYLSKRMDSAKASHQRSWKRSVIKSEAGSYLEDLSELSEALLHTATKTKKEAATSMTESDFWMSPMKQSQLKKILHDRASRVLKLSCDTTSLKQSRIVDYLKQQGVISETKLTEAGVLQSSLVAQPMRQQQMNDGLKSMTPAVIPPLHPKPRASISIPDPVKFSAAPKTSAAGDGILFTPAAKPSSFTPSQKMAEGLTVGKKSASDTPASLGKIISTVPLAVATPVSTLASPAGPIPSAPVASAETIKISFIPAPGTSQSNLRYVLDSGTAQNYVLKMGTNTTSETSASVTAGTSLTDHSVKFPSPSLRNKIPPQYGDAISITPIPKKETKAPLLDTDKTMTSSGSSPATFTLPGLSPSPPVFSSKSISSETVNLPSAQIGTTFASPIPSSVPVPASTAASPIIGRTDNTTGSKVSGIQQTSIFAPETSHPASSKAAEGTSKFAFSMKSNAFGEEEQIPSSTTGTDTSSISVSSTLTSVAYTSSASMPSTETCGEAVPKMTSFSKITGTIQGGIPASDRGQSSPKSVTPSIAFVAPETVPSSVPANSASLFRLAATSLPTSAAPSSSSGIFGSTTLSSFGTASSATSSGLSTMSTGPASDMSETPKRAFSFKDPLSTSTSASSSSFQGPLTSTTTAVPLDSSAPVFRSSATSPSAPIFGSQAAQSAFITSESPLFGKSGSLPKATDTSLLNSGFGNSSTSSNLVGVGTSTANSASVFGGTPVTSSTSVFKSTPVTSSVPVFGSAPATSSAPVFGSTPVTSSVPVFGSTPVTSSAPVFGSTPVTSSAPVFGSTPVTSSAPVFGSTPVTSSAPVFGSTPVTSSAPVFGSTPVTSSAPVFGSVSGTTSGSVFGSKQAFGSTTPTTSAPLFGGTTAVPGSAFGGTATAIPGAGFSTIFTPSTSGGAFGTPTTSATSVGGTFGSGFAVGAFGGLGGKPSEDKAKQNVFGGGSFGTSSTTPGIFGSGNSSGFQLSTPPSSSGAPGFGSGNSASSSQSPFGTAAASQNIFGQSKAVFGSPPAFGTQSGFGAFGASSKPVFGGSPTFGSSPTFGGTPTFGGAPTFGAKSSKSGVV
ncbi:unnamed protein product, partial [Darwinula stevensoni]